MNNDSPPALVPELESRARELPCDSSPVNAFAHELGKEAGARIGEAIAQEIHRDPEVRRIAATGAGVGVGLVVGVWLLSLASQ